ncbi:MAG: isopentenyl-diphosphate Delta-isomerase [Clostridia bacterium]|nr:isopentenyl-diphosphate Delta-isomerase [Clostridia bacterium]
MRKLILVDYSDREIGVCEKLEAHEKALLHRAFSVVLFNSKEEMLIQRRAEKKYHSAGLLTNSCCSHPEPNIPILVCAKERLVDEIGAVVDELTDIGSFVYFHKFDDGLVEYELDHVIVGKYDGEINLNKEEASECFWKSIEEVESELLNNPNEYTVWFKEVFYKVKNYLLNR